MRKSPHYWLVGVLLACFGMAWCGIFGLRAFYDMLMQREVKDFLLTMWFLMLVLINRSTYRDCIAGYRRTRARRDELEWAERQMQDWHSRHDPG